MIRKSLTIIILLAFFLNTGQTFNDKTLHNHNQNHEHASQNNRYYTNMTAKNVLGTSLKICCTSPMTGFMRDGYCNTGPYDYGKHLVCAEVTQQFLEFSKQRGNDLTRPAPEYGFPGLSPGDRWCLCASRWLQAYQAGIAPKIDLQASHQKLLEYIPLQELKNYEMAHPH